MSANRKFAGEPRAGKKRRFVPVPVLLPFFLCLVFLSGCATRVPSLPDPFALLGPDAAIYAVVPADAHRPLLALLARDMKDGDALLRAFDRTSMAYASVDSPSSLRILATGNFPGAAASLYFPSAKGWKKTGKPTVGKWYASPVMDAAVPKSGMVLLSSSGGMESFLGGLKAPVPVSFSPSFGAYAAAAETDGRIGVYVNRPDGLVSVLLGPDVSLPVRYAEIYAKNASGRLDDTDAGYLVSARVVMEDARTARAVATLLRLALGTEVRLEGENVYVDSFPVPAEKLVEWAEKSYFN